MKMVLLLAGLVGVFLCLLQWYILLTREPFVCRCDGGEENFGDE